MEKDIEKKYANSYNGQLDALFRDWIKTYSDAEQNRFCRDGLLMKHKEKDCNYDINKEWSKAPRKIMFLLKDCPDGSGYDTRTLLDGYIDNEDSLKNAEKTRQLKHRFFKNLAKILYGLYHMEKNNMGVDLNKEILNKDKLVEAFNEIPFAYIECKKLAGGKRCSAKKLAESMERDKENLIKEINILDPNMIVCCDGEGTIFKHIVDNYFGEKPADNFVWEYDYVLDDGKDCGFKCKLYYYKEKNILLFNSFHPTAHKAEWIIRETVLSPFRRFLNEYKTFGNDLRKVGSICQI